MAAEPPLGGSGWERASGRLCCSSASRTHSGPATFIVGAEGNLAESRRHVPQLSLGLKVGSALPRAQGAVVSGPSDTAQP